jgi:uncharacterized protein YggU (UPF0235/DUF167 family)
VGLRAAPEGGKANAELLALLARAFGVPRSALTILRGKTARTKVVRVEGVESVDSVRHVGSSGVGRVKGVGGSRGVRLSADPLD